MQIENQKGDLYALMAKVKEQHDKQGDFVTSTAQLQKATDADGNPQIIIEQNGGEPTRILDVNDHAHLNTCLLYTSPSPRDRTRSRMPSSA